MKKILILGLLFVSLFCNAQTILDYSYAPVYTRSNVIVANWGVIRSEIDVYINHRLVTPYSLWLPVNGDYAPERNVIIYNDYKTEQYLNMLERRINMLENTIYKNYVYTDTLYLIKYVKPKQ